MHTGHPALSDFNSSMVRLKATAGGYKGKAIINFNSSMVRLKEYKMVVIAEALNDFNSSMVRLKVIRKIKIMIQNIFQFQYGTIERDDKKVGEAGNIISIPVWYD